MIKIDEVISKHDRNSKCLKKLYIENEDLSYKKTRELIDLQDEEYKKMLFFKNLKREMSNNERKQRSR